jgi:ATP-binding cassette subfamily B protein
MIINPVFTAFTIIVLGGVYAVVMLLVKKRLEMNAEIISQTMNDRFKVTQEALGSIRDILLSHGQEYFSNLFNKTNWKYTTARASNLIIGPTPRFIVEALGVLLIAGFAYFAVMSTDGLNIMIPTLGAMALGAQRLLPNLQLIYIGVTNLKGQEQLIFDVVELLDQPTDEEYLSDLDPLMFENQIVFENVSFQFQDDSPVVLKGLSFSIAKGQRIGFAGPTGSGKSTTIDLLMGLLLPSIGEISVDEIPLTGKARLQWQKNIAHVPQDLYLMDASFAENIAFCKAPDDIDLQRVEKVAKLAHIHDFIAEKPKGYQSLLGERGVQLSGGQRQRVGIARALYRRASVIVLDEATSALDTEMETAVMSSIEKIDRNITIIMIAHRISTLKNCDLIYQLGHGSITNKMEAASIQ